MEKEEWFNLLKEKTQEMKNIARKNGKLISNEKARYLAKKNMPEFPRDDWK